MQTKPIRTRFAPSPTGFQHIGGFRTALYAWLWARKNNGQFLLRVEDTDQERRVPGAISYLIESLAWLGMDIDEGPNQEELQQLGEPCALAPLKAGPHSPYIQSLRKSKYKETAEQLIKLGVAYRCDCTPEKLEEERRLQTERKETTGYSGFCRNRNVSADSKHVIRLIIPSDTKIVLQDLVRGEVVFDNPSLRDTVLLKSDGMPTYHLAVVVDDHDMQITHVMRGEEWLPTAPVHLLLYKYLNWEAPQFAHLSTILGKDGKKLSKRHGAETLTYFKEAGFLPDAIINYIARVGWSLGDGEEQEIFSRDELIEKFSLDRLQKAGGTYDADKLMWTNSQYMHKLSDKEFMQACEPYFINAKINFLPERFLPLAQEIKERCKLLSESVAVAKFLFEDKISFEPKDLYKKEIDQSKAQLILEKSAQGLNALPSFKKEDLESYARSLAEELGLKAGSLFSVLRMAVTGSLVSPPLFESMSALGKDETLRRVAGALTLVGKN